MRFKDRALEAFWIDPVHRSSTRIPTSAQKILYRKLQILDAASTLEDLRVPPGNHLEKLRGAREGQYSIRVNLQWRLCFVWANSEATEVEFCDYH